MTSNIKYVGMDVHKQSISIAVRNAAGKIVMECVIATKASIILQFFWWSAIRGGMLYCKMAIRMTAWMRASYPTFCI